MRLICCELLSEFSIFDTNNNYVIVQHINAVVVNCFQNSVSLIPTTTTGWENSICDRLWIAFRIQYLWYQQQQICCTWSNDWCCELLSEFSIFDTNNNKCNGCSICQIVVNCFQNSVSLIPTTTSLFSTGTTLSLWIAFRIQYLWYQQQPETSSKEGDGSCELLSEFSIFDTNNNLFRWSASDTYVVNCFQNSVSLIPTTTN